MDFLKCDLVPPQMVAERGRKRPIIQQIDFIIVKTLVFAFFFPLSFLFFFSALLFHQILIMLSVRSFVVIR